MNTQRVQHETNNIVPIKDYLEGTPEKVLLASNQYMIDTHHIDFSDMNTFIYSGREQSNPAIDFNQIAGKLERLQRDVDSTRRILTRESLAHHMLSEAIAISVERRIFNNVVWALATIAPVILSFLSVYFLILGTLSASQERLLDTVAAAVAFFIVLFAAFIARAVKKSIKLALRS